MTRERTPNLNAVVTPFSSLSAEEQQYFKQCIAPGCGMVANIDLCPRHGGSPVELGSLEEEL